MIMTNEQRDALKILIEAMELSYDASNDIAGMQRKSLAILRKALADSTKA